MGLFSWLRLAPQLAFIAFGSGPKGRCLGGFLCWFVDLVGLFNFVTLVAPVRLADRPGALIRNHMIIPMV